MRERGTSRGAASSTSARFGRRRGTGIPFAPGQPRLAPRRAVSINPLSGPSETTMNSTRTLQLLFLSAAVAGLSACGGGGGGGDTAAAAPSPAPAPRPAPAPAPGPRPHRRPSAPACRRRRRRFPNRSVRPRSSPVKIADIYNKAASGGCRGGHRRRDAGGRCDHEQLPGRRQRRLQRAGHGHDGDLQRLRRRPAHLRRQRHRVLCRQWLDGAELRHRLQQSERQRARRLQRGPRRQHPLRLGERLDAVRRRPPQRALGRRLHLRLRGGKRQRLHRLRLRAVAGRECAGDGDSAAGAGTAAVEGAGGSAAITRTSASTFTVVITASGSTVSYPVTGVTPPP